MGDPATAVPSCPAPAALVVYAGNASGDDVVTLDVDGELGEIDGMRGVAGGVG